MSDTQSIQLSWQWSTSFPLIVLILLLCAAVWRLPYKARLILAAAAVVIAIIYTLVVGPLPWATLAKALADNGLATLIGLVVIFALSPLVGKRG